MEIKYEDWDRMLKGVEANVKNDTMSLAINQHVLKFVTKERDKYAKPELPSRSETGKRDTEPPEETPKS